MTPKLTPDGEGFKIDTAKHLICLNLVSTLARSESGALGPSHAKQFVSLLPRQSETANAWNPFVLPSEEPDHQNFEVVRWALEEAYNIAEKANRKDGKPTVADVKEAVHLANKGLDVKRQMPPALAKSAAERMAASKVVNVTPNKPFDDKPAFDEEAYVAKIERGAAERERLNNIAETKEALERPRKEQAKAVADDVKRYFTVLTDAAAAVRDLEAFLISVDRRHGTKYLDDLRENPTPLLTVADDVSMIQEMGKQLMKVMELANSFSDPAPGIDFETFNV